MLTTHFTSFANSHTIDYAFANVLARGPAKGFGVINNTSINSSTRCSLHLRQNWSGAIDIFERISHKCQPRGAGEERIGQAIHLMMQELHGAREQKLEDVL